MQLPKRRGQTNNVDMPDVYHVTAAGLERMKNELKDLKERQQPQAVEAMNQALQLGDFSENAEYQDAKPRLARMNTRILMLTERIKRASVIESGASPSGDIRLGSVVLLWSGGKQKEYQIVAPQESNPTRGRISNASPLGSALLGHKAGETVTIKTEKGETLYQIVEVK